MCTSKKHCMGMGKQQELLLVYILRQTRASSEQEQKKWSPGCDLCDSSCWPTTIPATWRNTPQIAWTVFPPRTTRMAVIRASVALGTLNLRQPDPTTVLIVCVLKTAPAGCSIKIADYPPNGRML